MAENMMNSAHKANSELYRRQYDKINWGQSEPVKHENRIEKTIHYFGKEQMDSKSNQLPGKKFKTENRNLSAART